MYKQAYTLPAEHIYGGSSFVFRFDISDIFEDGEYSSENLSFNFSLTDYQTRDYDNPELEYTYLASAPSPHFSIKKDGSGKVTSVFVQLDPEDTSCFRGKYIYQLMVLNGDGKINVRGQGILEVTRNTNSHFVGTKAPMSAEEESRITASIAAVSSYADSAGASAEQAMGAVESALAFNNLSESWAIGGTGSRDDEDQNNAKYYSELARRSENISQSAQSAAEIARDEAVSARSEALSAKNASASHKEDAENAALSANQSATMAAQSSADSFESASNSNSAAERAERAADNALSYADRAEQSASDTQFWASRYPYIDELTGNWMVFDANAGEFVNSGFAARGIEGPRGSQGTTFIPVINCNGVISWTNDGALENPDPIDLSSFIPDIEWGSF